MMALNYQQAKQIPITEYLSRHGFDPEWISGNDHWYLSPIRTEKNASFKVNTKLNLWFDHGIGEGGTLIDLGMRMLNCSAAEFLRKISDEPMNLQRPQVKEPPEKKLAVLAVNQLSDVDLLAYMSTRGVLRSDAQTFCREIDFHISNREYKAVGFANRSGGYELRNHWFKGSSSPKDITIISKNSRHVCVLEGFMDFLSLLRLGHEGVMPPFPHHDIVVLNSISLLKKNLSLLQEYGERTIFFDNDGAGKMGKALLRGSGLSFVDGADLYRGFKDLNEFLCNTRGRKNSMTRSLGLRR
jgi:DNA primase